MHRIPDIQEEPKTKQIDPFLHVCMFDLLKQEVDKNTLESERETAAAPVCLSRRLFVAVP